MANTKSALKRARQTVRRTQRNQSAKSEIKTLRKKMITAIEGGDKELAEKSFRAYTSSVDKGAKTGLIHARAAARFKRRAAARLAKA